MKPIRKLLVPFLAATALFAAVPHALGKGNLLLDWIVPGPDEKGIERVYSFFEWQKNRIEWTVIIGSKFEFCKSYNTNRCIVTIPAISLIYRKEKEGNIRVISSRVKPELKKKLDYINLDSNSKLKILRAIERIPKLIDKAIFKFGLGGGKIIIDKRLGRGKLKSVDFVKTNLNWAENAVYFSNIVERHFADEPRFCLIEQALNIRNAGPASQDEKKLLLTVKYIGRLYRRRIAAIQHARRLTDKSYDSTLASKTAEIEAEMMYGMFFLG